MKKVIVELEDSQDVKDFANDVKRMLGHRMIRIYTQEDVPISTHYPRKWPYVADYPDGDEG